MPLPRRLPPAEVDLNPLDPDLSSKKDAPKKSKKDKKEKGGKTDKKERKQKKETKNGKDARHGGGPQRRTSPNVVKLPPPRTNVHRSPAMAEGEGAKVVNAIMQGTAPTQAAMQGRKEKPATISIWLRLAKLIGAVVFAVGYVGLVIYLFVEVNKTNNNAAEEMHSEGCAALQCPSDSVCVDRSGRGHLQCSQNSYQNAQILQIVLGLVVGIPAVICLPCSAQWLFRTGGPAFCTWYSETMRRRRVQASKRGLQKCASSEMLATDSPRGSEDLEPGEVSDTREAEAAHGKLGFFGRLWAGFGSRRAEESDKLDVSATVSDKQRAARDKKFADVDTDVGDVNDDDILDHIFAGTKKKKDHSPQLRGSEPVASDEDDFLDLIFASRRDVPNNPPPLPPPDAPLEPPDEDLRDSVPLSAIFAPNAQKKARAARGADEESFGNFFHRPPNRNSKEGQSKKEKGKRNEGPMPMMPTSAPRRQQAGGDEDNGSRTEISVGLSAIFASTAKKAPGSRISAGSKFSKPPDSTASSQQDDFYEEEEEEVEDYGEAPDFIGFALDIARTAAGAGDDGKSSIAGSDIFGKARDSDAQSDTSISSAVDSLADLEPSDLRELFHPPI